MDNKSASITDDHQGVQFVYRLRDRASRRQPTAVASLRLPSVASSHDALDP